LGQTPPRGTRKQLEVELARAKWQKLAKDYWEKELVRRGQAGEPVANLVQEAVDLGTAIAEADHFHAQVKRTKPGGKARGAQQTQLAAIAAQRAQRLERAYKASEELQDQHKTAIAYTAKTTGAAVKTVRRRLKSKNPTSTLHRR
jgi:hypothetical protein